MKWFVHGARNHGDLHTWLSLNPQEKLAEGILIGATLKDDVRVELPRVAPELLHETSPVDRPPRPNGESYETLQWRVFPSLRPIDVNGRPGRRFVIVKIPKWAIRMSPRFRAPRYPVRRHVRENIAPRDTGLEAA